MMNEERVHTPRTTKSYSRLFELDLEGLASGIYILTATDDQGTRLSIKLPKP